MQDNTVAEASNTDTV